MLRGSATDRELTNRASGDPEADDAEFEQSAG